MDKEIQELKSSITNAKSILVLMPAILTTDIIVSALSIYHLCASVYKKETLIGSSIEIPIRFKKLISDMGIDEKYIIRELKSRQYIFSIPDIEKDMEIDLRREEGKISLYLKTNHHELNTSMIDFKSEGDIFDLVIMVGSKSYEALGSIYSSELFGQLNTINIDSSLQNLTYAKHNVVDKKSSTVSEIIYQIFESLEIKIAQNIASMLIRGIISGSHVFKKIENPNIFKYLNELFRLTNNSDVIDDYLYSLSIQGLKLRAKMLDNLQFDDANKTILSILSAEDFNDLNIDSDNLIGMDYLPFDICEGFGKSVLVFEDKNNKYRALIFGHHQNVIFPKNAHGIQNGDCIELFSTSDLFGFIKLINNLIGSNFNINQSSPIKEETPKKESDSKPDIPFIRAPTIPSAPVNDLSFGPDAPFKKAM